MKTTNRIKAACVGLLALLAACGHQPQLVRDQDPHFDVLSMDWVRSDIAGQRTAFDSVDAYKNDVAEHVMRYNMDHTFSGRLPPMLPAIVVLSITVDKDGRMTRVAVQRSRDDDASKVALASMYRSGTLPKPFNLATGPGRSLTFSETFLFNEDYRFQLRTLAGVQ